MIDLHSHILAGLDDGAPDAEASLAMARAAVAAGVGTMVGTPHVDLRFGVEHDDIAREVGRLNAVLARAEVALAVLPGAEIALPRLVEADDHDLADLGLGGGPYLLVESPYSRAASFVEEQLFDLQLRGFRPLLAHPERSPYFRSRPERLRGLVERGVICSVNTGSLTGSFGSSVRDYAATLLREGLVHAIASDAHDTVQRPPGLHDGLRAAVEAVPEVATQGDWLTHEVPAAILAGAVLPERPAPASSTRSAWWRRGRRG